MKTGLYIVATPIGNLGDISLRAMDTLKQSDIIACEDTRVTKKLFSLLGLPLQKTFIPLHDHNEEKESQKIINFVKEGKSVALVSDAGSPLISDPGYKLIKKAKAEKIYISSIPGSCAVIAALQLSGLPTNRFMFAGFIPNKDKARKDLFKELKDINTTLVFYETAPRILKTLETAKEIFPKREASIAREITKMYEECITDSFENLIKYFSSKEPKGEMVLMIAPPMEKETVDIEKLLKKKLKTLSLKDTVKEVVEESGTNKNEVYNLALKLKNEKL